mmetsp:Transcript_84787/g.245147  ORF Transcript_84787/g.245147 Transcript_84787/m.245147 type:complete len:249 (-) Transcript_84787:651-1397(-)
MDAAAVPEGGVLRDEGVLRGPHRQRRRGSRGGAARGLPRGGGRARRRGHPRRHRPRRGRPARGRGALLRAPERLCRGLCSVRALVREVVLHMGGHRHRCPEGAPGLAVDPHRLRRGRGREPQPPHEAPREPDDHGPLKGGRGRPHAGGPRDVGECRSGAERVQAPGDALHRRILCHPQRHRGPQPPRGDRHEALPARVREEGHHHVVLPPGPRGGAWACADSLRAVDAGRRAVQGRSPVGRYSALGSA